MRSLKKNFFSDLLSSTRCKRCSHTSWNGKKAGEEAFDNRSHAQPIFGRRWLMNKISISKSSTCISFLKPSFPCIHVQSQGLINKENNAGCVEQDNTWRSHFNVRLFSVFWCYQIVLRNHRRQWHSRIKVVGILPPKITFTRSTVAKLNKTGWGWNKNSGGWME